jgi:cation:H+ antiporter
MSIALLILGLVVLLISGELLVKGAVGLATKFHVSPLIIGLTIVSFGTSAPELIVCIEGSLAGLNEIVVGNIVGSNIANLALVLGLTCLVFPIAIDKNSIRVDWPLMMVASVLFAWFAFDQVITQVEAAILFFVLLSYLGYLFFFSKKQKADIVSEAAEMSKEADKKSNTQLLLYIIPACFGLYFGANWFLEGATDLAKICGVSDHVIGVTVVAFGTSVPELVTSMVAAFRKQTNISIGNIIGSNIFNLLGVLGVTGMIKAIPVSNTMLSVDIYWMLFVSALLFPLMILGKKLNWWKGIVLFSIYVAYILLQFNF